MVTQSKTVDALIKVKMIGDSGVGKTSIITRYIDGKFSENMQATIGIDYKNTFIDIQGKHVKMVLWDTAGQERFRTLTSTYYKGTNGLCVVFDVTSKESFESLDKWIAEFKQNSTEIDSVQVMLIANKIDLPDRVVSNEESVQYAKKNSMLYIETSAKIDKGIKDAFTELATQILERNPALTSHSTTPGGPTPGISLTPSEAKEKSAGGCC